jgi:hypothetical protein
MNVREYLKSYQNGKPEKLVTQGTQDEEKQINVREYIKSYQNGKPEKLATQGTQDEEKQSKNTTQYV